MLFLFTCNVDTALNSSTCTADVWDNKWTFQRVPFYGPFWKVSIHNWQPFEVAFTWPNLRNDVRVHTCMKWMKCTPSKISKQHSRRKTANAHVSIRALYPKDFDDVPCLPNKIYIIKTCGTEGCWTCVKNMSIFQLQLDGITKIIRCDLCHCSVLRQMLTAWALHVSSAIKADVNLEVLWCTPEPTKLTPAQWRKKQCLKPQKVPEVSGNPWLFQGNLGWWNIIPFGQICAGKVLNFVGSFHCQTYFPPPGFSINAPCFKWKYTTTWLSLGEDQHQGKAMKLEEELKQCEEEQKHAATLLANGEWYGVIRLCCLFSFEQGMKSYSTYTRIIAHHLINQKHTWCPPQRLFFFQNGCF